MTASRASLGTRARASARWPPMSISSLRASSSALRALSDADSVASIATTASSVAVVGAV